MAMKGVSLAIETIIFIILAVTVLSVLLLFFTTVGTPPQNAIELEQKRVTMCGEYIRIWPHCDQLDNRFSNAAILANVCGKLKAANCDGTASSNCFAECCKTYCLR